MDRAARCITGARGQVGVNIEGMIPAETGEAATRIQPQQVAPQEKPLNPASAITIAAARGPQAADEVPLNPRARPLVGTQCGQVPEVRAKTGPIAGECVPHLLSICGWQRRTARRRKVRREAPFFSFCGRLAPRPCVASSS